MLVLGIETTCDETACAIVQDGRAILANVITSQIDLHAEYGGVVPELACRRHVDVMIPVIDQALKTAQVSLDQVDLIAVAQGPGLIGALLIGINAAKTLALTLGKPCIGVNHVQAHLYAAIMSHPEPVEYPCLGVVLSGGHTSLFLLDSPAQSQLIAYTVDDAIGEAFDKVAKILGLPYPGGPYIEELAKQGDPNRFAFRAGRVKEAPLNFSFSGLKTAVLYAIQGRELSQQEQSDVAASFQRAAFEDVIHKTTQAADLHRCRTVIFGGGVTNNQQLRQTFATAAPQFTQIWPSFGLSLDNAAMIAGLGFHLYQSESPQEDYLTIEAFTR